MEKLNTRAFLAVAELGSFRKTAESLGYTQAGVSYIISSMEEEIGIPLFVREHNGVRLTSEGEALLPQIRQVEIEHRRLEQLINDLKGLDQGTLRVQTFESVSMYWIPGILDAFHRDFPNVRVELISEEDNLRAEQMVQTGEVDCGFFPSEMHSDLEQIILRKEHWMAVVAKDHPLAKLDHFPIAEIGNYPLISMKYDAQTGVTGIFETRNVTPQTVFRMDTDYAAMGLVSKGFGYCILPELLLLNPPYDLKCMPFDEPQTRVISIGTKSMETASNVCKKFMEYSINWVKKNGFEQL